MARLRLQLQDLNRVDKQARPFRHLDAQVNPTILYFAPEDWQFLEHFSVTGRAAMEAGFRVAVATRVRDHRKQLEAKGFNVVPLESERSNLGPLYNIAVVARMVRTILQTRPDVVHCIGLRMVVLAGFAARLARIKHLVLTPTGLVYLWINDGFRERSLRRAVRFFVAHILNRRGAEFIFENAEDPQEFGIRPDAPNLTIIGGVGVDPTDYPFVPEPEGSIKAAVVARMLEGKGIAESVEAVKRVRAEGVSLELHLYGATDPSSRMTLTEQALRGWEKGDGIFWHGRVANVGQVWSTHHIAMLLSYREGLARSLLEAAAAGRPIVTTDVVGCRDVIRDQIEGFIVPKGNIDQPAARLRQLATDPDLRRRMGAAAHQRFLERFTADAVGRTIRGVYCRIRDIMAIDSANSRPH
jgi:glycosyltransferase involved in cell wall biosynthesis